MLSLDGMAASVKAPLSLDVISDEGRPMVRRQGSLTPRSSSPKVDWKATSRGNLRRAQSVGSALSDFVGGSRNSAMRRSGSRGCLESLEASSNARAVMDGIPGDDRWEEDREWNFVTLDSSGGRSKFFPSPQFLSQEPWHGVGGNKKVSGKESFPRPGTQLKRSASTGQTKSIVAEQAQESFDSLKDRLESSLKMQPECSYAPVSPAMAGDVGVLGLGEGVGGLKLSTLPRSLKRRKNKVRSCAMSNAFSALLFIIKSMHGHMQEEHVVRPMQRDMDLSFAWLFQQVFATTPEYMLSIMVLLAEFTVHSLGEDMAMANSEPRRLSPRPAVSAKEHQKAAKQEDTRRDSTLLEELANRVSPSGVEMSPEQAEIMHALMVEAMAEMETNAGWEPPAVLDKETMKQLVAPVQVTVSVDHYSCFDRTELEYQHAISSQPTNVMLLSNYAQFLYVVRHDNNRAEEYFHRAIRADPSDSEALGRFATFLWLGRGDKETAERAFRAAAALDPTNPYHAGNYSHFLWHSEDSKHPNCTATCYVGSE